MGWPPTEAKASTYTFHNCQPGLSHPLNSAGFHREKMIDHYISEIVTNKYVDELRKCKCKICGN